VGPVDFRNWYTPTNTSGFPPVKPKTEFNPYSIYYEKVGFFTPTCFTDKRFSYYEYTGPGGYDYEFVGHRTVEFVENLFRLGMLTTESPRKPVEVVKPAEPAKPKFKYEPGRIYRHVTTGDFYQPRFNTGVGGGYVHLRGCVTYLVSELEMIRLINGGALIPDEEFQKAARAAINGPALSVVGKTSEVLDAPAKMLKPKKILVEWAIRMKNVPDESYYIRLYPEGATPTMSGQKFFKTGRTVEVSQ
jgi:hypothetical protein